MGPGLLVSGGGGTKLFCRSSGSPAQPVLRHAVSHGSLRPVISTPFKGLGEMCRRGIRPCRANDDTQMATRSETTIKGAMEDVVGLITKRDFERVVGYLSVDAVVRAAVMKNGRDAKGDPQQHHEQVCFLDVLDTMPRDDDSTSLLDSIAIRHLLLCQPVSMAPSSTLQVGEDKLIQRYTATSATGEMVTLTFTMARRSEQESRVRYSRMKLIQPWVVQSIHGEPASLLPPQEASPIHPPEQVIATYLEALRQCDMDLIYKLTSPLGRAVAGGKSRFYQLLRHDPRYQVLLMHTRSSTIKRCHSQATAYVEVVNIHDGARGSSVFCFVATLQTREDSGSFMNCWMVDYMSTVEDIRLVNELENY